jgi:hypothetical protein
MGEGAGKAEMGKAERRPSFAKATEGGPSFPKASEGGPSFVGVWLLRVGSERGVGGFLPKAATGAWRRSEDRRKLLGDRSGRAGRPPGRAGGPFHPAGIGK